MEKTSHARGAHMGLTIYSAPSNIALIKYMGKVNHQDNLPTNASISYTLEHLRTFVTLERIDHLSEDVWEPLTLKDLDNSDKTLVPVLTLKSIELFPLELSEKGKAKFLNHFRALKEIAKVSGFFKIKSANNFPSDCGIASSSSSFAALTLAAMTEFQKQSSEKLDLSASNLSALSRKGSGSSCRSFYSPWCVWKTDRGEPIEIPYKHLHHIVLLLDKEKKEVSSSDAHKRVTTSPLFPKRMARIQERFESLMQSLQNKSWVQARQICGAEFEEMHQLFETSEPPFSYRSAKTFEVLQLLSQWEKNNELAPLITMDAGSNIHLLFRSEDKELAEVYAKNLKPLEMMTSWGLS